MEENIAAGNSTQDLKWAKEVYAGNLVAEMPAAYEMLADLSPDLLKTSEQRFEYAEVAALICHRLYKNEEARQYALKALAFREEIEQTAEDSNEKATLALRFQELERLSHKNALAD